jgi:hypothetical protein
MTSAGSSVASRWRRRANRLPIHVSVAARLVLGLGVMVLSELPPLAFPG